MIESATEFISRITKEKIKPMHSESLMESRLKVRKEETSFAPDVTVNVTERDFNPKSEVSMRELSGRNLMEENFNKAALYPKSKKKIKDTPREPELIKLSPRRKKWFISPLVIFGLIIMIFTVNLVKNEMLQFLDSQTSSSNLFDIFKQSTNFPILGS